MHVIASAIIKLDQVIIKSQGCSQRSASGANLAILEAHLQSSESGVSREVDAHRSRYGKGCLTVWYMECVNSWTASRNRKKEVNELADSCRQLVRYRNLVAGRRHFVSERVDVPRRKAQET